MACLKLENPANMYGGWIYTPLIWKPFLTPLPSSQWLAYWAGETRLWGHGSLQTVHFRVTLTVRAGWLEDTGRWGLTKGECTRNLLLLVWTHVPSACPTLPDWLGRSHVIYAITVTTASGKEKRIDVAAPTRRSEGSVQLGLLSDICIWPHRYPIFSAWG